MGILKIPWENFFPVGILKIPTGFFSHIIQWDFFPTGKIRKNKMCVLSRQSLLSAIHIADKKLYGSIHKFNFSHGIFSHSAIWEKNPMGFFDFLKLLISEKLFMK